MAVKGVHVKNTTVHLVSFTELSMTSALHVVDIQCMDDFFFLVVNNCVFIYLLIVKLQIYQVFLFVCLIAHKLQIDMVLADFNQ